METNFSGWSQKRFKSWLSKNYPDPKTRWVEVVFAFHHDPRSIFHYSMADDYEICIAELARELAMLDGLEGQERWDILIRPASRRKEKQMWLRTLENS